MGKDTGFGLVLFWQSLLRTGDGEMLPAREG